MYIQFEIQNSNFGTLANQHMSYQGHKQVSKFPINWEILSNFVAFFKKTEIYLPAGFPSLERTLFGGGLRMACSLLNSKRSLEERSNDLGR